jgi:hypothetical protein
MVTAVFLGVPPGCMRSKGGEDKMRPVRVKWITLPLCKIGFDRNFDSPIVFYRVLSLWIATSGREGP